MFTSIFTFDILSIRIEKVCQAGKLSDLLSSREKDNVSTLVLSGTMDIRDFEVLCRDLPNIDTLDIENVKIMAYDKSPSNTLPENLFDGDEDGCKEIDCVVYPKEIKFSQQSNSVLNKVINNKESSLRRNVNFKIIDGRLILDSEFIMKTVKVFDALGRIVEQESPNATDAEIILDNKGIFIVKVIPDNNHPVTFKVVNR